MDIIENIFFYLLKEPIYFSIKKCWFNLFSLLIVMKQIYKENMIFDLKIVALKKTYLRLLLLSMQQYPK